MYIEIKKYRLLCPLLRNNLLPTTILFFVLRKLVEIRALQWLVI